MLLLSFLMGTVNFAAKVHEQVLTGLFCGDIGVHEYAPRVLLLSSKLDSNYIPPFSLITWEFNDFKVGFKLYFIL